MVYPDAFVFVKQIIKTYRQTCRKAVDSHNSRNSFAPYDAIILLLQNIVCVCRRHKRVTKPRKNTNRIAKVIGVSSNGVDRIRLIINFVYISSVTEI